jgi:mannose-6-phosphate isomerase-like protein (cupin superfamily)
MAEFKNLVVAGDGNQLKRLSCTKVMVEQQKRTERLFFPAAEAVYYVTAGYGVMTIESSLAEWEYPLRQDMVVWLSDSADHYLKCDGEAPLHCVCFKAAVDVSVQEPGKEVQRRLVRMPEIPVSFREKGAEIRNAFRGDAIGSRCVDTVEQFIAPPHGHTPAHRNEKIEGILYFLQGSGRAASQDELQDVKAGDTAIMSQGGLREIIAGDENYLQCVVMNVFV